MKTIAKSLPILVGMFAIAFCVDAKGPDEMNSYYERHGELRLGIPPTSANGTLRILLFRENCGFPFEERHAAFVIERPVSGSVSEQTVVFKSIPFGEYAVYAYCDTDGNGRFDRGSVPSRTELSGYTKTGHTRRTVPYFEQCVFEFTSSGDIVHIDWKTRK